MVKLLSVYLVYCCFNAVGGKMDNICVTVIFVW